MIKAESGIWEMLRDPDEGHFVQAMLGESSRSDSLLASYAGYLEGRDRDRGEFLRLEVLLSARGHENGLSPEVQSRHQDVLGSLAPFHLWLRLVRRNHRILNCGQTPEPASAIRFRFQCPTSWEALAATPREGVRHCAECRRDVYYCDDIHSAERHALAGDCITIPVQLMGTVHDELDKGDYTGMLDVVALWGEKIFGTDGPTKGAMDSDRAGTGIAAD